MAMELGAENKNGILDTGDEIIGVVTGNPQMPILMPVGVVNGAAPFTALPTASTNGTLVPCGPRGVRFHLPSGSQLSYTKSALAPTTAPTLTETLTATQSGPSVDVPANAQTANIYLVAVTGTPFYEPI